MEWDATVANVIVALKDNPGRMGRTTGKTKRVGDRLLVQVDFGPTDKPFKRFEVLTPVDSQRSLEDIFRARDFGGPQDLRRVLTYEKLKGRLTNVFYSMEVGNTDFYPHQFKPVLKFIESTSGRMLIADEVGLGKTIESIYIWKELQARYDARRLLIICPAMLREKWQGDLYTRFGIHGEIVGAKELATQLERVAARRDHNATFTLIASLEGIRTPAGYDKELPTRNPKIKIAQLLEDIAADGEFDLLDLVIVDEAHYMRNPDTSSFRLGKLVRDGAQNLLLLTATPVQTENTNLYNMMRLVDPDTFFTTSVFDYILEVNRPIVDMLRALQHNPVAVNNALESLQQIMKSPHLKDDQTLIHMGIRLSEEGQSLPISEVTEYIKTVESRSLLSRYMSRTRKRDVIENRIVRSADTQAVQYSDYEKTIYRKVSSLVFREAKERTGIATFVLISRQRQMASCLPAALDKWKRGEYMEDLEMMLWEDLGIAEEETEAGLGPELRFDSLYDIDIDYLEEHDSKYQTLKERLDQLFTHNSEEKCIVFAFFRDTLSYLRRKLTEDGFSTALIQGGMKPKEKSDVLTAFELPKGPQILLSSEVGSEGIDLQFCHVLVNYDLPWNPMRVEQRIGRLDRLGQKAEKITIINMTSFDTIEERILKRLYDRIELFKMSVGDMEEILGKVSREMMTYAFDPDLTEEQKESRAIESIKAVETQRHIQNDLEDNAINLVGFTDYIYSTIGEIRNKQRWIGGEDLFVFVSDFFSQSYPGTVIERTEQDYMERTISLSEDARVSLQEFIHKEKPQYDTMLHRKGSVHCTFDQKAGDVRGKEKIHIMHSLIQWIRSEYMQSERLLHPVTAVKLSETDLPIPEGVYTYLVQRWTFKGIKEQEQLAFVAAPVDGSETLSTDISESLVQQALNHGVGIPNARNNLPESETLHAGFTLCSDELTKEYEAVFQEKNVENKHTCANQLESAKRYMERQVEELTNRIKRYKEEGRERTIPATEGLIRREKQNFQVKQNRIEAKKELDEGFEEISAGVIVIAEY